MSGWAVTLLRGLARWMAAIGGWLLRRRARRTWAELAAYLRIRGDHLEERAKGVSSRSQLRAEWLTARARRWRAAAAWLDAKAPDLDRALEDVEARAKAGVDAVPDRAIEETFVGWRRARGR
ncbi:MAG: hypothetical protein EKK62_16535 [Acidimicrobiia bacterium]|nr:MAG: hypothetical protein EKK62_16535 [Acidimicrobiia bacterium]